VICEPFGKRLAAAVVLAGYLTLAACGGSHGSAAVQVGTRGGEASPGMRLVDPASDGLGRAYPDIRTIVIRKSKANLIFDVKFAHRLTKALKEPCCWGKGHGPWLQKGLHLGFEDSLTHKGVLGASGLTIDLKAYPRWKRVHPEQVATSVTINKLWNAATFIFPLDKLPIRNHALLFHLWAGAFTADPVGADNFPQGKKEPYKLDLRKVP
jgi:hypothetical protein